MPTKIIKSDAYVLGVTKAKVIQDVYKVIYTLMNNNVTDTHSPTRSKWWFPSWPDSDIDNKNSYPIGIIESPKISWEKYTLTRRWVMISVDIEIYHYKKELLDQLSDEIIQAIETKRNTFRGVELRFVNLEGTSDNTVIRDKIKVHSKIMTFSMQFHFTRTY